MQERNFYLYINGQHIPVSEEVYREYCRAEDKERYFMGRQKKGHTKVNLDTQEIHYIPSRELSYEQLVEREVAGMYDVSQNTIHYRKNRLLDKLKKMMEK